MSPETARSLPLARWADRLQRSVLRQMIAVVSRPGVLSFAGGLPDPALFPTAAYSAALQQVLADDPRALQYGPPFAPLKEHIAALMAARGVTCRADDVFLTTGAQQALDVLTRLFLNPGDLVILEENIYTGIQQVLGPFQPRILTVPTDLATGLDVDAVEEALLNGARPAFIYVIPDGHNPLGVTMALEKRRRLVELAHRYQFVIIEDDPYGFLSYDAAPLPPLRALDGERVLYVGSFSKILAPGLRLGWVVVPPALLPRLTVVKEAGDLESAQLTQRAVAAYLDSGALPDHIAGLCHAYGARRDALLAAVAAHFPAQARWTTPGAGMFVWVALPPQTDTRTLLTRSLEAEQIAFIPGHAFSVPPHAATNCLRLTFSTCSVEQIHDGIARLGRVVHSAESAPPIPAPVPAGL